jgi:hypothetical protein
MEHQKPNPSESALAARHEVRDASPSPIVVFAIALVVTLVVVHFIATGALRWIQHERDLDNQAAFPTRPITDDQANIPPDPRLEPEPSRDVLPYVDLVEVRQREQVMIGDHAWGGSIHLINSPAFPFSRQ